MEALSDRIDRIARNAGEAADACESARQKAQQGLEQVNSVIEGMDRLLTQIEANGRKRSEHDAAIVAALKEHRVELICLAGYMRLLSPYFVAAFPNRILNIHPSLLPSFPGLESQRQALEYGVQFAGCTVHFVDENLDAGPIVLQAIVEVKDHDTDATLSERILKEEHRIYSEAVKIILAGNFKISGRRVVQS